MSHKGRPILLRTLNHAQPGSENGHKRDRLGCYSRRVVLEAKGRFILYNCNLHNQSLFLDFLSTRRRRPAGKLYHQKRTFGPGTADSAVASASQPTISEISWTSDFTSFALVLLERSWLSFATRHGCLETWTLAGRVMLGNGCEEAGRKSGLNTGSVVCASSSELVDNVLELSCE